MRKPSGPMLAYVGALLLVGGLYGPALSLGQDAGESEEQSATQENEESHVTDSDHDATMPGTSDPIEGESGVMQTKRTRVPLLPGSTPPPTNLKLVGDHWTPYDPPSPESLPPDAAVHIIERGDTLWDLADLAFGNPYLWPQIWNENRYILDSHWIYPGDPLLMPLRPTVVTQIVPHGQAGAPPMPPVPQPQEEPRPVQQPLTAEPPVSEPPPQLVTQPPSGPQDSLPPRPFHSLANKTDMLCSGSIRRKKIKPEYFIANQWEEAKVSLTQGDFIYLNRGTDNSDLRTGAEYSIVILEGKVYHPITDNKVGWYYKRLGIVQVIAAQERTAIARISMACDDIRTGYPLVPFDLQPLPERPVPKFDRFGLQDDGEKAMGYIVHSMDNLKVFGTGYVVEVDLGSDDGLQPGDFLTIFIPNSPYDQYRRLDYQYRWGDFEVRSPKQKRDRRNVYPPKVIGQMLVLHAEERTATAKVIYAIREIEVGNMVVVN